MKIVIDREKCCGAGMCTATAPEVFDQSDDDGLVVLLDESPGEEQHAAAREAADLCPGVAISVR